MDQRTPLGLGLGGTLGHLVVTQDNTSFFNATQHQWFAMSELFFG
jgi:hypothetical protein